MFKWEVKEMKLKDIDMSKSWNCLWEKDISREDKVDFIDKMNDGKMTYLLNLIDKFNKEKDDLKKDNYGHVKTVSLKAWLKKNDPKRKIDDYYHYGEIYFFGYKRYIQNLNETNINEYINEIFHRQMIECQDKEEKYFREHDEMEILKHQIRKYSDKYRTDFGNNIWYHSRGGIGVGSESGYERELTKEELTKMLNGYEKLEKYIDSLSSEINIEY